MASNQATNILQLLNKPETKQAPDKASFTFICENAGFKDEGYVPEITAGQYRRILAILKESLPVNIVGADGNPIPNPAHGAPRPPGHNPVG